MSVIGEERILSADVLNVLGDEKSFSELSGVLQLFGVKNGAVDLVEFCLNAFSINFFVSNDSLLEELFVFVDSKLGGIKLPRLGGFELSRVDGFELSPASASQICHEDDPLPSSGHVNLETEESSWKCKSMHCFFAGIESSCEALGFVFLPADIYFR